MAPGGRSRKARITRMDAAIDAMTKIYGFSEEIVTKVLKKLLKEYGGDDGWFFIEQYSYRELVEAILCYQEENYKEQDNPPKDKPDTLPKSGSLKDEKAEEEALADADAYSGVLAEIICSKTIENGIETNNRGPLPPTEKDGRGWKDVGLDQSSSHRGRADAICGKDGKYGPSLIVSTPPLIPTTPLSTNVPTRPDDSPVLSSLARISPPSPVKNIPSKKRQPCYGWIENDEEDVDDFIHLTPGVEWENSGRMSDKKAKQVTLELGTKDS